MDQLQIFVIVQNSANVFFTFFGSKISACRSEDCNNRTTGKRKQRNYFHRNMKCLFYTINVFIKFDFELYINKK